MPTGNIYSQYCRKTYHGHRWNAVSVVMLYSRGWPDLSAFLQGVVVFFPSFTYADEVYEHWQASGALSSLSNKKHVFREPRSAVEVESVLR